MDNIVTINNIDYTIDIKPADHYNIILDSHNPEGLKGDTGNGISSIEKTSTSGLVDTYTIAFTDGNETTFDVTNGSSIDTIEKTSTVGLVDTYTITLTNGDTSTFTVTNGKDGVDGADGVDGTDATINGVNTLTLTANYGLTLTQSGSTANISGKEITDVVDGISAVIPAEASESNKLADKAYVGNQIGNGTITINQGGSLKGTFTTNQSGNTTIDLDAGGSGGGAVDSVNGQTGDVVLTASDVGALPSSTVIPDAQIQSDWTQADNTKVDYIKNKPTIPTDTSDLTNGAGYITGITSTDVTNALGYTPYSSANPNGYTSNVGTVTSVNNVNPVSGNVTLSIPTVNNATLTITQGGTTKGTFTANASSDVTIALDAGGSGGTWGDITGTLSDQTDLQDALDEKIDVSDCATIYPVISTYVNGTSWYRVYSDGWCEQGGEIGTGTTTVTFLKTFASIPLCWTMCDIATNQNASGATATTTGLTFSSYSVASRKWQASGYLASGEY